TRLVASLALMCLVCSQSSPPLTTTAPQCKCSDIDECSAQMEKETERCKKDAACVNILKETGGEAEKIVKCLDDEHKVMAAIETCVKEIVGGMGCTTDAVPKNLTIPLVPIVEIEQDGPTRLRRSSPVEAPPQLSQFLVCVDQCAVTPQLSPRSKRSAVACAYKLQCALESPDEKVQSAFMTCEKKLNINPEERLKQSCKCLKDAGISSMTCN
ncbi:hypothetical protein PFISCL1PPCAC_23639, partial [Pristionchus fissidentatus]